MVDSARGTLLHRFALDAVLVVADSANGLLLVTTPACARVGASPCASHEQTVVAINAQTGAVLWTVLLGVMPQAFQGHAPSSLLSALVAGPRGRRIVLVGRTGVRVLDLTTRTLSAWTPLPGAGCAPR